MSKLIVNLQITLVFNIQVLDNIRQIKTQLK